VPIPPDCVRTNIVWALPDDEIAVNTLNFHHEHVDGNTLDWAGDMTQRYANLVRDGLVSAWGSISAFHSNSAKIVRVDAYHLDTNARTLHKATALPATPTALQGTATGGMLPPEVAGCLSLYGYPIGGFTPQSARKRGRIFLPGMAVTGLQSNGRWGHSNQVQTGYAAAFSYMSGRKMDARPTGAEHARLVILSKTGGIFTEVVAVSTDNVYDVQRRRQNNLIPVRSNAVVTPQPL
jgi:hypothetical protein